MRSIPTHEDNTMNYRKPQITSTLNAVSAIHQQSWTTPTMNGVAKTADIYQDREVNPSACTTGAYEADE
jgi:hypothetical protein